MLLDGSWRQQSFLRWEFASVIARGVAIRAPLLCMIPILLVVLAACGRGSEAAVPREPVSARVIVTDVQVSADGERVESITVRTDDDKEIAMGLGDKIDPAIWGRLHLLSHAGLGKSLGLKIGVTYVETSESVVAIELTE